MPLIGMFHYRAKPDKVSRAYNYASVAKMEGIEFFFFSSKGVNLKTKTIMGLAYEDGNWIEKEYPYPDVVMNVVGPKTKKQIEIYQELKKSIPFTSFPVGTKLSIYKRIEKGKLFVKYLLPFAKIKKPIDALIFLNHHSQVILKPTDGKHGNNVLYIERNNEMFIVKEKEKIKNMSRLDLLDYISELLKDNRILLQKYVCCRRKTGDPYDIRLHLQKDKDGKWLNTIIYPKIGLKGKIATNLDQGGQITNIDSFLFEEFEDDYFNIKRYLELFSLQFAKHFESLYNHEFDELGIDIGIDENKKIWIYEVNWRPGHLYIQSITAYNAIMYAYHIANQKKGGYKDERIKIK